MLVTAFAGAMVGIPSFRLEGAYLALATLGLAESVRIVISGTDWLGAAIGYEGIPPPYIGNFSFGDHRSYYFVVMPFALLGLYFLLQHPELRHRPCLQGAARGSRWRRQPAASTCASTRYRLRAERSLRRLRG
jgi:branched-chain amino acid transport system permease protein